VQKKILKGAEEIDEIEIISLLKDWNNDNSPKKLWDRYEEKKNEALKELQRFQKFGKKRQMSLVWKLSRMFMIG